MICKALERQAVGSADTALACGESVEEDMQCVGSIQYMRGDICAIHAQVSYIHELSIKEL